MPSNCDFQPILDDIYEAIAGIGSTDTSALESRLDALESSLGDLQAQIGNVSGRLPIIEANALAGMTNGQKAMAAIAALAAGMAALEAKAAIAESLANQAQQRALQAIGVGNQAIGMAGNAQSLAGQALNDARNLAGKVANNAGKIAGLLGRVAGIAAAIAGIGGLALGLRNSNAINGLRDSISGILERLSATEKQSRENNGLIQGLIKQFKALGQTLQSEVARLEALIDSRISQVINAVQAMIAGLAGSGNDTNIDSILGRIADLSREIGQVGSRVGNLSRDVGSIGSRVGSLQSGLNQVGSRVGAMGADLQGLWDRTGQLSRDLNGVRNQAKLNAKQIASILAALAALGIAVAALQAKKLMCRYNEAQVGQIATAVAGITAALSGLKQLVDTIVVPFTEATTKTLEALTDTTDKVKKGVTDGFKWLSLDRVIGLANLAGVLHNATFLSRDIVESVFDIVDTVMRIMGKELIDSEGEPISTGQLVSGRIERAIVSKIGIGNYSALRERWNRLSTIYTSAANVFGSLRSISDSIVSGVEIAASYSAKIGNSLQRFGVIPEKVFPWMSENPNFNSRLMNALEKGEEIASSMSSITSEVLSISEESREIAKNSVDLKARLASKNPDDGTDWDIESGIQSEIESISERATQFSDVKLEDIPYSE